MIDESIKKILKEKHGDLNFNALLEHMESTGVDYLNRKLHGPMGIATFYCIYLNMEAIMCYPDKLLYFIILHETAHYKRIQSMGGKDVVIELLSNENFDDFFNHIIGEEIFADRYGCFTYRLLNKHSFPREITQNLHLSHRKEEYKKQAKSLFGVIKNSEENYRNILNSLLIDA